MVVTDPRNIRNFFTLLNTGLQAERIDFVLADTVREKIRQYQTLPNDEHSFSERELINLFDALSKAALDSKFNTLTFAIYCRNLLGRLWAGALEKDVPSRVLIDSLMNGGWKETAEQYFAFAQSLAQKGIVELGLMSYVRRSNNEASFAVQWAKAVPLFYRDQANGGPDSFADYFELFYPGYITAHPELSGLIDCFQLSKTHFDAGYGFFKIDESPMRPYTPIEIAYLKTRLGESLEGYTNYIVAEEIPYHRKMKAYAPSLLAVEPAVTEASFLKILEYLMPALHLEAQLKAAAKLSDGRADNRDAVGEIALNLGVEFIYNAKSWPGGIEEKQRLDRQVIRFDTQDLNNDKACCITMGILINRMIDVECCRGLWSLLIRWVLDYEPEFSFNMSSPETGEPDSLIEEQYKDEIASGRRNSRNRDFSPPIVAAQEYPETDAETVSVTSDNRPPSGEMLPVAEEVVLDTENTPDAQDMLEAVPLRRVSSACLPSALTALSVYTHLSADNLARLDENAEGPSGKRSPLPHGIGVVAMTPTPS